VREVTSQFTNGERGGTVTPIRSKMHGRLRYLQKNANLPVPKFSYNDNDDGRRTPHFLTDELVHDRRNVIEVRPSEESPFERVAGILSRYGDEV